ncbi:MAG TPA: hypothetical protein VL527_03825 [Dongiaceae bacterium]|nr:hypothetical protein [Dongiaceae bacterium]
MQKYVRYLVGLGLAAASMAHAGTALFDFNSDPTAGGQATLFGSALWNPIDGVGYGTNTADGFLEITPAQNSKVGAIVFADIDNGAIVGGLHLEADVRVGNGSNPVADGFSINYARASDPVLTAPDNNGNWGQDAGGGNGQGPEEGTKTGIGIGFDAFSNDGNDPIGMDIRVDGALQTFAMPTLNGSVTDPTSIQTGPNDGTGNPDVLGWAHLIVDLNTNGILNVYWKGAHILVDHATGYVPGPGQLLVAGRTGGYNQNQDIDNISITTYTVLAALGPITGLSDGVKFTIYDSGPSVVDPNTISFTINGGNAITPAPSSITKSGTITTVTYHEFPTLLASGSTNQLVVSFKDTLANSLGATRSFTVPVYHVLPGTDAVTGVNTSLPGYRLLPWQSPNQAGVGEPNAVYWMQEQLMGLHGTNNADLSTATDGGYIDYTDVVNFNLWGLYDGYTDSGNFKSPDYPDTAFPGIPGANGLTGSIALEFLTYLQFDHPGVYTMGVNSDDGFAVTEGANPRDRLATELGRYNGGRGSSDTLFDIVVPTAGIYPVRLVYENGAGEGSGNGSNLEWFMVDTNNTKILINDPSGTNDTGVKAFYSGPALPAFVSQINPYVGQGNALPHKAVVQLTDGATTVSQGTIQFTIDGAALGTQSITKAGAVTTVERDFLNAPLASGSAHTATLVWSDSLGTTHSNTWPFTVESYVVANAGQAVAASGVDNTQPGFVLHVTQLDPGTVGDGGDGIPTQIDLANALLAGTLFPWYGTNTVDTTSGPSVASNMWYWTGPMDFNDVSSAGDFTYDAVTPGLPGVTVSVNNYAEWFDGYVVFPSPGYYRMSVSSDDGFRLSPGLGLARQVLHIQGAHVNRDVAAVVSDTLYGNGGIGTNPPVSPITAPVVFLSTNNYTLGQATNLTGKIVAIDGGLYGLSDAMLCYIAQTNGALAFIDVWSPAFGLPYVMTGTAPAPITIPTIMVNGFGGERDTWITNTDLTATIGASESQVWGSADYGKGMGRIDIPVIIPAAGAYPLHLTKVQGGGGSGLEWQNYEGYDGVALGATNMVLIDDSAVASSLQAYRAVTVLPAPTISISKQGGSYVITYTGVLQSSATVTGTYQPVSGASSPYTVPTGAAGKMFYRASN